MLNNCNIETRLRLGTTLILLLLLTAGLSAYLVTQFIYDDVELLVQDTWPTAVVIGELRTRVDLVTNSVNALLLTDDPNLRQEEFNRITQTGEHITRLLELLKERITGVEGEKHLKQMEAARALYLKQLQETLELLRRGGRAQAASLVIGKLHQGEAAYFSAITDMAQFQNFEVNRHGVHAANMVEITRKIIPALLLAAVILLLFITRIIANGITRPVKACLAAANQIAAGDFSVSLENVTHDETGLLQEAMARMVEAIKRLVDDTEMLTRAAAAGELTTRADPARHQGEFRLVVVGINETLDAVIGPLNVAAEYVERIAAGNIPPPITDPYQGDFLEIKNNLNSCIAIMNNLLTETLRVIQAAAADNLDERANPHLFSGDWNKLVTGVNTIIETIVNPLKQATNQLQLEIDQRCIAQQLLEELNENLEARVSAEVSRTQEKDRALMQNEKMATLGLLAAGVAHEINNPMGYLSSNLRVLNDYFFKITRYDQIHQKSSPSLPTVQEAVQQQRKELDLDFILQDGIELIKESLEGVDQVKKIVQELKGFSRTDAEERQPVELNCCLERALTIVRNELKHVATVRREYTPLPPILCHPGQLNQVFLNLLVNAGQAITAPGEIVVKSWHDESFAYASVSDTGCGMPEEVRGRIFDPFFTTKEQDQGTGLGLSISHEIIKNHRGEIVVASDLGVGTTFTVRLPLHL